MSTRFLMLVAALLLSLGAGIFWSAGVNARKSAAAARWSINTLHDFTLTSIDGEELPLNIYEGQVVLLVNTASFCGNTPQYEGLEALQAAYAPRGFTVIGVPSGDFLGQEHGTNAEIKQFCETKFGISFPLTEKSHVKGKDALPVFQWAAAMSGQTPGWNFHKYLIGRDGRMIKAFGAKLSPLSADLTRAIEQALGAEEGVPENNHVPEAE